MPLSATPNSQKSPSRWTSTRTTGATSGRWNFSPLPNRLSSSWRSSAASPCTCGRSPMTISPSSSVARRLDLGRGGQRDLAQVDGLEAGRGAADPGEGQQVVDQPLHALRAVDREPDVLVGPLVELPAVAALQELAEAGDLAQRFLQVVARDVGELLEVAVGPLQVAGLLVEAPVGLLEQVDLVRRCAPASRRRPRRARRSPRPAAPDLSVHVAGHHVAHLVGEGRDGVEDPAPQPPGRGGEEGGDGDGDRDADPAQGVRCAVEPVPRGQPLGVEDRGEPFERSARRVEQGLADGRVRRHRAVARSATTGSA